jgi:hypothetical protein
MLRSLPHMTKAGMPIGVLTTPLTPSLTPSLTTAQAAALAAIRAELGRVARYDDESIVHERWIRQRYQCGCHSTYAPARQAVVRTAWHEAGHAVAALAIGARFSSASIHHGPTAGGHSSEGRVHGVAGGREMSFVVDAAGQLAERLMGWTMLDSDAELRAWLPAWRLDGGDARRFRLAIRPRYGADEVAAWRYCERLLTPHRLRIRELAKALLVHPRHLPYGVAAELVGELAAVPATGS